MTEAAGGVEVSTLLHQAIKDLTDLVRDSSVALTIAYPAHLPAVGGEPAFLSQVLREVLSSVIELTSGGELVLEAELSSAEELPASALLLSGEGASETRLQPGVILKVSSATLEIGEQLLRALVEAPARSGEAQGEPGLQACAARIAQLGGQLWIESAQDRRFAISFSLPLAASSPFLQENGGRPVEARAGIRGWLLALMAEPERMQGLQEQLGDYAFLEPAPAASLLQQALDHQPDLIILDLQLFEPSAFDLAKVLLHHRGTRNIPLLFCAASSGAGRDLKFELFDFLPGEQTAESVRPLLRAGLLQIDRVLILARQAEEWTSMKQQLAANGIRCFMASSPQEALARAEEEDPDLVLISADLAEEHDYWALRALRQIGSESAIFVLGDDLDEGFGRRAVQAGATGFSSPQKLIDLLTRLSPPS